MNSMIESNHPRTFLVLVVLAALSFVAGYYYYQQKDKDTILDMTIGGKKITAQVEHQ